MQLNGIAHIQLTVNNFEQARTFYRQLFAFLDMKIVMNEANVLYGVGSKTGIAISPSTPENADTRFDQRRIGLHHFCLRCRAREDVDAIHQFLLSIGARIIYPPQEGEWAPGYYSVLCEDPEGIRIEFNYVPGKGLLAE
jgi:catechol 2,3-dioxygenase-like lactoylglutathione lyase family enzyme